MSDHRTLVELRRPSIVRVVGGVRVGRPLDRDGYIVELAAGDGPTDPAETYLLSLDLLEELVALGLELLAERGDRIRRARSDA